VLLEARTQIVLGAFDFDDQPIIRRGQFDCGGLLMDQAYKILPDC